MTPRKRTPIGPERLPYVLFGRAAVPAIIVALVCVVVAALVSGSEGFAAALIGAVIVVVFYLFDLVALRVAERRHGSALMPIMLTAYIIKVGFLAILVARLWQSSDVDMEVLAATVVAATVTWTSALAVVAMRAATFFVSVEATPELQQQMQQQSQPQTTSASEKIKKGSTASSQGHSTDPS